MELEKKLFKIGYEAVLNHPKSKLYAKVNCEDNFCLAMHSHAESEILGALDIDNFTNVNWLNNMTVNKSKKLYIFVKSICQKVYNDLRLDK
jgi:hypothetical protein